jgi:hypothetical protein
MSRVTAGQLTGQGYTLASGAKYTKTTGTASATVDLATTDKTGVASIQATTPGVAMTPADFASHMATLASLGVTTGIGVPATTAGGLQYYGTSV